MSVEREYSDGGTAWHLVPFRNHGFHSVTIPYSKQESDLDALNPKLKL